MWFFRLLGGLLLVGLFVGLAGSIFQAGVVAGAAGGSGVVGVPWYGWQGFGWGFGGFHLLGTIFTVFLIVALIRFAFGGGRHRDGHHGFGRGWEHHGSMPFGSWEDRARERHDAWHRGTDSVPPQTADAPDAIRSTGN
ncbi:MAG: hypothetical protein ABI573_10720 [Chloroflexota bacterium]